MKLPQAYRCAGLAVGIKANHVPDMALIISDVPATLAGVFTTNQVAAAPVKLCRERLASGAAARAIVVNSGNANACTGPEGLRNAHTMAAHAARALQVDEDAVLVCSTGHIGDQLPMPVVLKGIDQLAANGSPEGGEDAARAIMTTDIRIKTDSTPLVVDGQPVVLAGMAKGAGMIEPHMATMLAFLMTDARVEREALQQLLKEAVNQSFNRITVDGDQSTNDTVLMLANGAANHAHPLQPGHPDWETFAQALRDLTLQLALKIVDDGEGSEKRITVRVEGAANDADADRAARAIANSFLVKTSWAGEDANWGRLMDSLGYSGARVEEEKVDIWYDDQQAVCGGVSSGVATDVLCAVIARPVFGIRVHLNIGKGQAVVYTCEITEEYVRINVV